MITSVNQFLDIWKQESKGTHDVFAALTDESLAQSIGPDNRTLGRIAWHLTQTLPEMMNRTGLEVRGPDEHTPPPPSASKILAEYDAASNSMLDEVRKWNDSMLNDVDEMYGQKWKKGQTLMVLILHQAHHRGQMTVLMRQAGLRLPSFYGPVREDWAQWGMKEPEI